MALRPNAFATELKRWAADGRTVRHVVVDGRVVVRDGRCITIDIEPLRVEAADRQAFMLDQVGMGRP